MLIRHYSLINQHLLQSEKKPIDKLAAQIKIHSDKDSSNMFKDFMIKVPKIL